MGVELDISIAWDVPSPEGTRRIQVSSFDMMGRTVA